MKPYAPKTVALIPLLADLPDGPYRLLNGSMRDENFFNDKFCEDLSIFDEIRFMIL